MGISGKNGYRLLEEEVDDYKTVGEKEQSQNKVRATRGPIREEENARPKKEFMRNFNSIYKGEVFGEKRNIVVIKYIGGSILRFMQKIVLKKLILVWKEKMR